MWLDGDVLISLFVFLLVLLLGLGWFVFLIWRRWSWVRWCVSMVCWFSSLLMVLLLVMVIDVSLVSWLLDFCFLMISLVG